MTFQSAKAVISTFLLALAGGAASTGCSSETKASAASDVSPESSIGVATDGEKACESGNGKDQLDPAVAAGKAAILAGQQTFRFDTFGDEAFWGDTLKLHEAIEGK